MNPYLLEVANIREHSSWVHQKDKKAATEKASDLIRMAVAKSIANEQLHEISVPVTKRALVIGGGIAGIQAALDIADARIPVVLVEKSPSIGGRMAQLDETFPTLDCSQCILTPKMVDVASHPYIELIPYSEVLELDGFVGNYKVKIKKKASYVNFKTCTGCGACWQKCPVKVPNEYNMGIDKRKAIYTPFPPGSSQQAGHRCRTLHDASERQMRHLCKGLRKGMRSITQMQDEIIEREIGAVVVATGYDLWDPKPYEEYGVGRFKDIITSLEFERMVSANGPTNGVPVRPSDGKVPKNVVFIKCIGSRDEAKGIEYCSKICCMYTAKHAILLHHKVHDSHAYIFYMDIRAAGKGYEEFVKRAQVDTAATYLRGTGFKDLQEGRQADGQGRRCPARAGGGGGGRSCSACHCDRSQQGQSGSCPIAGCFLRQIRLHVGSASETSPGGDSQSRYLPGRLHPGAQGYPRYRCTGIGLCSQGMRTICRGYHEKGPDDLHRSTMNSAPDARTV